MIITNNITVDLKHRGVRPWVGAVAGDGWSREVAVTLLSGGEPFPIPADAHGVIRYRKPDGHGGVYDTLPDGSLAWRAESNVLTITLAPQMLNLPGDVLADVVLLRGEQALGIFPFLLRVEASAASDLPDSEDYFSLSRVEAAYELLEQTIAGTEEAALAALPEVVAEWFRTHPEALITVPDGSVTKEKLSEEVLLMLERTGLSFDSGHVDESGYLHLTLQGADIEGFTPFYVGAGGGSGGGTGAVVRLTTSLLSRVFSIMDTQASCLLPFHWSSVDTETGYDTGPGTAIWQVNGTRVAAYRLDQGASTFDIRPYLSAGASHDVLLTIQDAYGSEKKLPFTIDVVSFLLSWDLPDLGDHRCDSLTVNLTPTGAGAKKVFVTVDDETMFEKEVLTTGRNVVVTIPPQSHGAHTVKAWMEATVYGETLSTEPLVHACIWTEEGNFTPVVALLDYAPRAKQYETVPVRFLVVNPSGETATVQLAVNGKTVSVLNNVLRQEQVWSYRADSVGVFSLGVQCANVVAVAALVVAELDFDIAPVTAGLVLDIDPAGRSNLDANRESFGYFDGDGVNHPFRFCENFDWERGGFRTDEEGVTAFVVPRGCFVTADRSLFSDDAAATGKAIKVIFKTTNVRDYDAVAISCVSGGIGLELGAQTGSLSSMLDSTSVRYCEDKKLELDVNIQRAGANAMACLYMRAIPSAKPILYDSLDSWTQSSPAMLTIGSDDCDVWLYRMKLYGSALTRFDILDNYIADCGSPEEMVRRYLRNDIFNTDGSLSISKISQQNPGLRTVHIKADRMTTGKDDEVLADVEIRYAAGGEAHHLIAKKVPFKAQGTSSLEYVLAALNLDMDFGAAESWENGEGEAITAYAFGENSIPVSYFNFKADVASSESANNVVLCDEYNAYNPVPFGGKAGGVRDCIEGHPCAVFFTNTGTAPVSLGARTVAPGETALYFAGNMNNSKKNFEVFGWDNGKYPRQCCVEVLNNIALQCRFRSADLSGETWDGAEGTSNFEFAFPKRPTEEMKDRFRRMQAWVVSTAADQATEAELTVPAVYGGVTYLKDTPDYRRAKFLAEFDDYFVRDQVLFHYLFTERHCMADNRAKNTFFCYDYYDEAGDYRWSLRRNYDNDTAEGCDNSGGATFTYGLELDDMVGDSYVFNANDSVLWQNIRALMHGDLLRVYKSNKPAWDAERILRKFTQYQAATPEALRGEDMHNKYFAPMLLAGEPDFLKRCHGTKEDWREQFERYQEVYFASEYCDTSDRDNVVSLRTTIERSQDGDLTLTPYSDMYLVAMYGTNAAVRKRAKRNVAQTLSCPVDSLTDTETYIFSASNISQLGDLSKLKTKFVRLTQAKKLLSLTVGSGEAGYQNLNMTELTFGSNPLLEEIDIRGLPNLTGAMNLSALAHLRSFQGTGSGITSLTLADGAPVKTLRAPALTAFTAKDLTQLEKFTMDGSKLRTLHVERCPAIDTAALCAQAGELLRGRLVDVDWTLPDADVLLRLASLSGLDALGAPVERFVLTGSAHVEAITGAERAAINEAFPELSLTVGQVVPGCVVTFRNWDGTVLHTQTVRQGGTAVNPVLSGLIPVPEKAPSVYEVYSFNGWDTQLTNIQSDLTVTATFAAAMRYYTVNFWKDLEESLLLQTVSVPAMGTAVFDGTEPAGENGAIYAGWDKTLTSVSSDLQVHALYVQPKLPDVAAVGYDYLYSDDPADESGYTKEQLWGILYYGRERDYFALGDKIKLLCDTDKFTDKEIVLALRSFKHFESAERSGWAGPYFGMVGVMDSGRTMNGWGTNSGGFPKSAMFTALEETYFAGLPKFWRSIIEKIQVLSSAGDQSTGIALAETHLTLESQAEVGFNAGDVPYKSEVAEGADEVTFSCYTDNNSRIKKQANGTGAASVWWLRSPQSSNSTGFCMVYASGGTNGDNANRSFGVAFGFCLRNALAEEVTG